MDDAKLNNVLPLLPLWLQRKKSMHVGGRHVCPPCTIYMYVMYLVSSWWNIAFHGEKSSKVGSENSMALGKKHQGPVWWILAVWWVELVAMEDWWRGACERGVVNSFLPCLLGCLVGWFVPCGW